MRDEHEGHAEECASSHVEDVCREEDQITSYDTPSKLTNEATDTSVLDEKDEDKISCPTHGDYEDMSQSINVEDPTSPLVYDADDEGGSTMLTPSYDAGSTPHPSYHTYDDACVEDENEGVDLVYEEDSKRESYDCIVSHSDSVSPFCDLENRLLLTEEKIVQVLMRADGVHKFIEDIMWKTHMEERHKGVVDGITSTQLRIIKEALEQMKYDYLQLFMDRDLALKLVEDKERDIEELCYQMNLVCSSSLTTTKTPSFLAAMT
jgi:hypothetical protein